MRTRGSREFSGAGALAGGVRGEPELGIPAHRLGSREIAPVGAWAR
jgi:hypothetical protein